MSILYAFFSGILIIFSFPPFYLGPLIFISLVPLILALKEKGWKEGARLGFLTGFIAYSGILWWLSSTMTRYGNLPPWFSWPVVALLVCYMSIYLAIWSAFFTFFYKKNPGLLFILSAASLWTVLEWIREHLLSGFPWATLAHALSFNPSLIQTGDIWGPYGISFIIVALNVLLAKALTGRRKAISLAVFSLSFFLLWGYGEFRIKDIKESDATFPRLKVHAIQGSVPQEIKWEPTFQKETINLYKRLSIFSQKNSKDNCTSPPSSLFIWPETATPFYFQKDGPLKNEVMELSMKLKAPLLFGSPAFNEKNKDEYYNSAYLLGPDGNILGRYDKSHLVPFGEYMPWGVITAWAKGLLPYAGEFKSGTSSKPLSWGNIHTGIMICFESIFPAISRATVLEGANLLTIITNDAWFGKTGAPYQHEGFASLRAVETRRWTVRAANTGVSTIISPWGERFEETELFKPATIEGYITLREGKTFFVRYGPNWFLGLCVMIVILAFLKGEKTGSFSN